MSDEQEVIGKKQEGRSSKEEGELREDLQQIRRVCGGGSRKKGACAECGTNQ